jgi:hypothetical protein
MPDGTTVLYNLDWFFQRGLLCENPLHIESIFHRKGLQNAAPEIDAYQRVEMSDHDIVVITCRAKV